MKRTILMTIQIAAICLLASGAMAQTDPVGDQIQRHNYNDAPGIDANGGINRHGDEFAGETGPHGPFGAGPDDELLKFLGLSDFISGQFSEAMWQKSLRSNLTGSGFGQGGGGDCDGEGIPDQDRMRTRAGRRR